MRKPLYLEQDWSLDDPPLYAIDLAAVRAREDMFYLVAAASFIEIAADVYSANLMRYFDGDDEVVDWLAHRWQVEETRHGRVLRAYIRHVWPEFDWERAYAAFFADYSSRCTIDEFEPTRGLEMVARCVVETGTSTYYEAMARSVDEPVLAAIAMRIRADEINHYKHFYGYFRMYDESERPGRWRVLTALARRVLEARQSDAECALWHVFSVRREAGPRDEAEFHALCSQLSRQVRSHYPVAMAAKMLLKPLKLPPMLARGLEAPLTQATRWIFR